MGVDKIGECPVPGGGKQGKWVRVLPQERYLSIRDASIFFDSIECLYYLCQRLREIPPLDRIDRAVSRLVGERTGESVAGVGGNAIDHGEIGDMDMPPYFLIGAVPSLQRMYPSMRMIR